MTSVRLHWSTSEFIAFLILALIVAGLEIMLLNLWGRATLPGSLALAAHGAVVVVLAFAAGLVRLWRRDARMADLLLLAVAVLGPVGALGGVIGAIALFGAQRRAALFDAWQRQLLTVPSGAASKARRADKLASHGAMPGRSLWAVMQHGNYLDKLRLIAWLARHLQRESVPLISAALRDSDPAVRVQAATVVEKHEHAFTREWVKCEAAVRAAPEDADAHWQVGYCCDEYAYLGLVDTQRLGEIRARARAAYERCLQLEPEQPKFVGALLRLLVRSGDFAAATELYQRHAAALPREAMLWYCEALFGLCEYAELRKIAAGIAHSSLLAAVPGRIRGAIELWADPAAALHAAERRGALVCLLPEPEASGGRQHGATAVHV